MGSRRVGFALVLALVSFPLRAQVIDHRHQAVPVGWYWGGGLRGNLPVNALAWQVAGRRPMDLSAIEGTDKVVHALVVGAGNPASAYHRPWEIDVGLPPVVAAAIAQANGMMVTAMALFPDVQAGVIAATIREQAPPGIDWLLVPATTQAGIQQWLVTNPGYEPYAVDSVPVGGGRFHVLAHRSLPGGPAIPTRSLVFGAALASLPLPSVPGGVRVIDIDQYGPDTYAAVVETPLPGSVTHHLQAVRVNGPVPADPDAIHGHMERVFVRTSYRAPDGTYHETVLVTNNAWSICDIGGFPSAGPITNYRGSPTSFGVNATLGVTSSTSGVALPGSTLSFGVSPVPPGASVLLALGFERQILVPVPGVLVLSTTELILPVPLAGTAALTTLTLPTFGGISGLRFYAQAGILEGGGFATTNLYMITVL